MPCYDGREDEDNTRNYQLASVLCGVITKHGISILNTLDWKEIGVDRSIVLRWWDLHLAEDKRRRERAQAEVERNKNKLLALSKLPPEDMLRALGYELDLKQRKR